MISRETFAGGKYVLDTLITGGMRVLQSFCTGSFKLFRTVPVRELQESHTRPVSLLFHPAGGKYAVGASYQLGAVFTPAYITETDVTCTSYLLQCDS